MAFWVIRSLGRRLSFLGIGSIDGYETLELTTTMVYSSYFKEQQIIAAKEQELLYAKFVTLKNC